MRSPEELQQERIDEIQKEKHLRNEIERLTAMMQAAVDERQLFNKDGTPKVGSEIAAEGRGDE